MLFWSDDGSVDAICLVIKFAMEDRSEGGIVDM